MRIRLDLADKNSPLQALSIEFDSHELTAAKELIALATRPAIGEPTPPQVDVEALPGERIGTLTERYCASANWQASSREDIRGDLMQIARLLGDSPLRNVTRQDLGDAQDRMRRLPVNMNKLSATRGKSVDEILALGLPPQSATNVKKKWKRFDEASSCVFHQGPQPIQATALAGRM